MIELTADQRDLRDLAAKVAREVYAPRALEWDRDRTPFPADERRRLGELGLLALPLPEEYGGGGRPLIDALIVQEELAKANPLAAWPVFEASAARRGLSSYSVPRNNGDAFCRPLLGGR